MNRRRLAFVWLLPVLGLFLGLWGGIAFGFSPYQSIATRWKRVGGPPEPVAEIAGVGEDRVYVKTESGQMYSLAVSVSRNPPKNSPDWVKEENPTWRSMVVEEVFWVVRDPPVRVKQLVKGRYFAGVECIISLQYALSEEGELWVWSFPAICGSVPAPVCYVPVLGAGLGLAIALAVHRTGGRGKKKARRALKKQPGA